ncbi:hypothetical protein KM707_gp3 [Coconut foliar decay alphasatellite 2]|uniref:Uncharacterized protein n=1 Tax=Coconut foliar decay alphasatellite 2 TaxID=2161875 RepID=A0A2R4N8X1_9VIRU|nr:hypothetical protein KM707_gp3 [Coconut foliar decay alphasatellite 2]AVX29422.1 hypothetical protein [Coconut foliar decay alphasatellite 2]
MFYTTPRYIEDHVPLRILYVLVQYILSGSSARVEPIGLESKVLGKDGLALSSVSSAYPDDCAVICWLVDRTEQLKLPIMVWVWERMFQGPSIPFHRSSVSNDSSVASRFFQAKISRVLIKSLLQSSFASRSSRNSVFVSYLFFRTVHAILFIGTLGCFEVNLVIL